MKSRFAVLVVLSGFLATTAPAVCGAGGKVLLVAREQSSRMEYMLLNEVDVCIGLLAAAGYEVEVATASGAPIVAGVARLTPQLKYSEIDYTRYMGVLVPCLAEDFAMPERRQAAQVVRQAARAGLSIAAQMGGVAILGDAGVLDGKAFAIRADSIGYVPNGIYKGTGVVRDGNVVTSGICPYTLIEQKGKYKQDGTVELMNQFVLMLSEKSTS